MIKYTSGDIFTFNAQALINPVNCVGVMGKGLALEFKRRFPNNYKLYVDECEKGWVFPGRLFSTKLESAISPQYIINFPTKRHWKDKSNILYIRKGLWSLEKLIRYYSIGSVAIPALGCGLGGLSWEDVRPLIDKELGELEDVDITVFEPQGGK